ncbi:hypothetical protein GCM10017673_41470 [Streptosporangium violaceochromogenes]|nr:hypothetical protein GCM10017673_41470 [Streptosporangium violaceochromogenes]
MRRSRRGAPLFLLLALLLPLFVPGGLSGETAALLRHQVVTAAAAHHQPLSRQITPAGRQDDFLAALAGIAAGAGGSHPVVTPPHDLRQPPPGAGLAPAPARLHDPRPLSDPLVRPGRAPPSTGV